MAEAKDWRDMNHVERSLYLHKENDRLIKENEKRLQDLAKAKEETKHAQ